ncbi:glycosyltransferase [Microlunatus parietis]|uniref:GT2 family glycosyltransferase n=1 Tax=Microlunatus parietis TaxID=682979 RepID=A0A7Y9IAB1_9ACTN|nr:glycosyltransferase [Microlunatus parietis]NYE73000.1 GT2 family glycosyltransferase [Microlunatus parietis]
MGGSDAGSAIVIVNFGSHRLLAAAAADPANVLAQPGRLIIVVDNHSGSEERAAVQRLTAERGWCLVPLPDNRGFGAGVNAGVRRASELGAETVILLNPDAVLAPATADALHQHCRDRPDDLVSPRLVDSAGKPYFSGAFVELATGAIRNWRSSPEEGFADELVLPSLADRFGWLTAACLAVSVELWQRSGGLAEDYFLYWEDVDFSVRCARAGARLVLRNDLVAAHDEGGTQRSIGPAKSDLYYRYNCRNRLLFARRLLGRRQRLRWLAATPAQSWQIYLRGGRRQLLSHPAGLLAALRGTLAGLFLLLRPRRRRRRRPAAPRVLLAHPSADLYGSDRMLLESAEALRGDGWRVTVVLPYQGPLLEVLDERGFDVRTCGLPALRKAMLTPAGLARFMIDSVRYAGAAVRLIREAGTDLVYVNTLVGPGWMILGRLTGRRVVCHVHEAERRLSPVVRRVLTAPLGLAHRVITNSQFTAEVLGVASAAAGTRNSVVHNGLELPEPQPPRPALTGPVRLVYCGRLSRRKGPQTAIAAVRLLAERDLDVRLELLGAPVTGQEGFEAELRELAAPLGERVRFRGFHADPTAWLADADLVVVPSIGDESYGNAAVEAAAAGRPVVITDQPGLIEAVGELPSVRVVTPDRPDELADALAELIKDWEAVSAAAARAAAGVRAAHAPGRYRRELAALARAALG